MMALIHLMYSRQVPAMLFPSHETSIKIGEIAGSINRQN